MKNNWIVTVFVLTFILSIVFSALSNVLTVYAPTFVLAILLIVVISLGILFDVIGTAAISGNEATFHALNTKRIKGAKMGLFIVKNGPKISSTCNDIVGDVSGIISGSIGAVLAIALHAKFGINEVAISVIIAALISSLTVGGKAIFKPIAIKNADKIITTLAKTLSIFGGDK